MTSRDWMSIFLLWHINEFFEYPVFYDNRHIALHFAVV